MNTSIKADILGKWQAGLAIEQQRLSNSEFSLDVNKTMVFLGITVSVDAKMEGLDIEVLDSGQDMIMLKTSINGGLQTSESKTNFTQSQLEIITSFETAQSGDTFTVQPKLDDSNLTINLTCSQLKEDEIAAIETILKKFIIEKVSSNPFEIFSFKTSIGNGAGVKFEELRVTSAYARYSPEYSSFLLLMREEKEQEVENDLVIDPHIMPTGQTAVLWISNDLMERTGGKALIDAAENELTFRPRPMNVDIPDVSTQVNAWVDSIIKNISIPGGLTFTSMELQQPGLMLSATPLSLEELDSFTATDITQNPPNIVQAQAENLFKNCVYYYMKDNYRKYLIEAERPVLPREVLEISKVHSDWYAEFGRLQIAQAIKNSDTGNQDPFKCISKDEVDKKLKALSTSEVYADQTSKLYSLAFCLVYPRISLYMEDAETWKPRYSEYIKGEEYLDKLMNMENPAAILNEAISKITLFDLSGESTREVQSNVISQFSQKVATSKWQVFVREKPDQVKLAVTAALQNVYDNATGNSSKQSNGDENSSNSPSDEDKERVKDAIEAFGGASDFAGELMEALRKASINARVTQLQAAINNMNQPANISPSGWESTCNLLAGVASIAVLAVFFMGCEDAVTMDGLSEEEKAKKITNFTVDLIATAWASGELLVSVGKIVQYCKPNFVTLVVNRVRELVQSGNRLARGVTWVAETAETICKVAGSFLAIVGAGLALWDCIDDFRDGKVGQGVADLLLAISSAFEFAAIVLSWSGPIAIFIAACGVILMLVRMFAFSDDDKEKKDAVDDLNGELKADGVVLA